MKHLVCIALFAWPLSVVSAEAAPRVGAPDPACKPFIVLVGSHNGDCVSGSIIDPAGAGGGGGGGGNCRQTMFGAGCYAYTAVWYGVLQDVYIAHFEGHEVKVGYPPQ